MWMSIIMQNNFVVAGVVVGALSLECSTQSYQLCWVDNPSNCFIRFEQLIIHDTKLIPLNTQQEFFTMNVWLSCRCWHMARWSPWFLPFWVIMVNSFFVTSDYTVQKTLSFIPGKQQFTRGNSAFNVSQRQYTRNVRASSSCVWHES